EAEALAPSAARLPELHVAEARAPELERQASRLLQERSALLERAHCASDVDHLVALQNDTRHAAAATRQELLDLAAEQRLCAPVAALAANLSKARAVRHELAERVAEAEALAEARGLDVERCGEVAAPRVVPDVETQRQALRRAEDDLQSTRS